YYQRGGKFRYLDFPVSNFEAEQGLSSSSALRANKEKALVNGRYHTVSWKFQYMMKCAGHSATTVGEILVPDSIAQKARQWNYDRIRKRRLKGQKSC
ncbi:MAG: hypothetical protein ACRCSQ_06935, partial [Bacteroidales bacterium]